MDTSTSEPVYCICAQPYDPDRFMIQCDICKEWFHGSCIGVKEYESTDIVKYHCSTCSNTHGPSQWKTRSNWHRHDYADDEAHGKPVQTGTHAFVNQLKERNFPSADSVSLHIASGELLTLELLLHTGFASPILIDNVDGLGLRLPDNNFTVADVMDLIGSDYVMDVIDVLKQEDIKMTIAEWVEYYNSYNRDKVYNVISLEVSNTRLSDFVKPPTIVQRISWVENCWPSHMPEVGENQRPAVMKYCLMGTENSFTDFHIDFGGSSVWYHVLRGEKIFYLVRPTPLNLKAYEDWMKMPNRTDAFFGDLVVDGECYRLPVRVGQTLFIPTGWIHAVLTPTDSMVFGGNFLHSFNIALQLQVYEAELRMKTPYKFLFPSFETVNWFATSYVIEQLKGAALASDNDPPMFLITGAKALLHSLKMWPQKTGSVDAIPPNINVPKLTKELSKAIKNIEKKFNRSKRKEEQFADEEAGSDGGIRKIKMKLKRPKPGTVIEEDGFNSPSGVYDFNASDDDGGGQLVVDEQPSKKRKGGGSKRHRHAHAGGNTTTSSGLPPISTSFPSGAFITDGATAAAAVVQQPLHSSPPPPPTPGSGQLKLKLSLGSTPSVESPSKRKQRSKKRKADPDFVMIPDNVPDDDFEGGRASPSTRDAIQGMLSMSHTAFTFRAAHSSPAHSDSHSSTSTEPYSPLPTFSSPSHSQQPPPPPLGSIESLKLKVQQNRQKKLLMNASAVRRQRNQDNDDFEEAIRGGHEEGDFIYLDVEGNEEEGRIFKSRGRHRYDEAWNPRGFSMKQVLPKEEPRPAREGVKKEVIGSMVAEAKARLSHKPEPKRPYHRRKAVPPKPEKPPPPEPSTSINFSTALPDPLTPKGRRPKKGYATAKQRLGKILKIHKMVH